MQILQIRREFDRYPLLSNKMISASEALQVILQNTPLLSTEKVDLSEVIGRTLARDVKAREDVPSFDNSSMDGFAVASSSLRGATQSRPRTLKIAGESSAGNTFEGQMRSGQAVRIMTGGIIPGGADAVVPIEQVTILGGSRARFTGSIKPGQHVRKRGEDIRKGEVVLHIGRRITPGSIGVLASIGHTNVWVYKKPRVAILATGNELVEVEDRPSKGKVRNGTSLMLAAYVHCEGGDPRLLGIVPDRREHLRNRIKKSLSNDVLLVTGGVSVGKYDYVKRVLEDLEVEIKFWKVNIKPGMPLVFGKHRNTLVFGLPGNPVSTGVTFLQFVRPALRKMVGREDVLPMRHTATLDQDFVKTDGKRHYLRGIARQQKGELHVTMTGIQSSGAMSSLSKANCLLVVPEEQNALRRGDAVEIEFL